MRGLMEARTDRARSLRRSDNDAERRLWSDLRGRRLDGFKFVRQFPIGRYFSDFACREAQLVVELDGSQHALPGADVARDAFIVAQDWSVLRFWNVAMFGERAAVSDTILAALEYRLAPAFSASDLRLKASATYRVKPEEFGGAPHARLGHLLPVKNGEKGAAARVALADI